MGDDPYKPRAYEKAARAVGGYPDDLRELDEQGVLAILGIGKSIAAKVTEYLRTARSPSSSRSAIRCSRGAGDDRDDALGLKKALAVYEELDIGSVDELVAAAEQGELAA